MKNTTHITKFYSLFSLQRFFFKRFKRCQHFFQLFRREALADYEKCFEMQKPPRLTDGLHSMAQVHERMGDYAAAIRDRQRIIKCLREE